MIATVTKPPQDIAGYDPVATAEDAWYDPAAADKSVEFFHDCLTFVKGGRAKQPFDLEQFQADVNRTAFGWKRPDGTRRYRTVFIFLPRKNGKSTWIAGIGNLVLFCDGEAGAECYCAASDKEQAGLVYRTAAEMVRGSEYLSGICKVRDSQKRIVYPDRNAFWRAIPANEGGSHGFDSHLIVGDELHAWPGREFYDVLHTSTGARSQPMEIYITTAGWDRQSICYEVYRYACQVRDGQIKDNAFLPVIYEAAENDDWMDPQVWRKANPNLGVSVSYEYLEREAKKALENPRYENTFRRLHLNQWVSQEVRFLNMDRWRACRTTPDRYTFDGYVFGGLDLSQTTDLTAWVVAQKVDDGWKIRGHYWMPESRIAELSRRDRVPYAEWIKEGWVTATPGEVVDYDAVHERIISDAERYKIQLVGYDPWNAEPTRQHLEEHGLTCVQMRQGAKTLSMPAKELERSVIAGTLDHGSDPVLEWHAENVAVKPDENGNIRPVKPKHGSSKKIDGIVAAIMAIGVGQLAPEKTASVFDSDAWQELI